MSSGVKERQLKVLEIPVPDFEALSTNPDKLHIHKSSVPNKPGEVTDYDRVRFYCGQQYREYEFEGISRKSSVLTTIHLGDLRLRG